MNAAFDPDTNEISNDEKWVGHGDQSEGGRWTIEDGRLLFHVLNVDSVEDQEVNPVTVFKGN